MSNWQAWNLAGLEFRLIKCYLTLQSERWKESIKIGTPILYQYTTHIFATLERIWPNIILTVLAHEWLKTKVKHFMASNHAFFSFIEQLLNK